MSSKAAPPHLRVFAVWEPILPTDLTSPSTPVLARLSDRRVVQFWDPAHVLSPVLARHLPLGEPGCCLAGNYMWDEVAIFPPGAELGRDPPQWISGPVADSMAGLRAQFGQRKSAH